MNSKGFNLVEMMVGVAILAVVALAGATLAQVADQSTEYPDRKLEVSSLGAFIMGNLKNAATCQRALGGNNLLGANANGKAQGNANGVANGQHKLTNGPIQFYINDMANLDASGSNPNTLDPSGPLGDRQIFSRRLQVNDLYLDNAIDLGSNTYLASVYLNVQEIGGERSFKTQMIGSLTITTDGSASGAVATCQGVPSEALSQTCGEVTGMNCDWDQTALPKCRCKRSQSLCPWPGYYPVKFTQKADDPNHGIADCRPLGGDRTCPAGEYLTGIGLDEIRCAPVPTTCPTGTSQTGAGNAVHGLIRCRCNNSNETYFSGTGCQPATTPTPTPASVCTPIQSIVFENIPQDCQNYANTYGMCTAPQIAGSADPAGCVKTIEPFGANECKMTILSCTANPTPTPTPTPSAPTCAGTLVTQPQIFISSEAGGGTPGVDYVTETDQMCRNAGMQPWHESPTFPFVQDKWHPVCCNTGPAQSCTWTQTYRNQAHHSVVDLHPDPFMETSWDNWKWYVANGSSFDTRSVWYLSNGQSDTSKVNGLGSPETYLYLPACDSSRNGVKAFSAWAYGNASAGSRDQWGHVCNCP